MQKEERVECVTRNNVMNLLDDDEVAAISAAETTRCLSDGDQYIDLEHLDQGVQEAIGMTTSMRRVLPKHAVPEDTWKKILAQLQATPREA